jgi:hypothetical protein
MEMCMLPPHVYSIIGVQPGDKFDANAPFIFIETQRSYVVAGRGGNNYVKVPAGSFQPNPALLTIEPHEIAQRVDDTTAR